MTRELSRKLHEAKARKRMSLPSPDYPPILDYEKVIKTITVEDSRDSSKHVLHLFHSRRRKDMWLVKVDGKLWKKSIGYSHIMALIRKAR